MADAVDRLLKGFGAAEGRPASEADVAAIETRFGGSVPAPLRKLWRASDGTDLEALEARLLGPTEILRMTEAGASFEALPATGMLPLLDDRGSNFACLHLRPPLAPRTVFMHHDGDGLRLAHREVEGLFLGLVDCLEVGESADEYLRTDGGDYAPDAPRTAEDRAAARDLLATDGANGEWNLAIQLLDAADLTEWRRLLETDHFVRREAVARLRKLDSPEVRELLEQDVAAFKAFVEAVVSAAGAAGLAVEWRGNAPRIGGIWMNLDSFFHRRNVPDAVPRAIRWIEDLAAGRKPRDRPDHFFQD